MVRTDSKQKKLDAFMTSRLHDSDEVRRSVAVNHLSDAVFFCLADAITEHKCN